jgi:Xaa-Pro dipeptidase
VNETRRVEKELVFEVAEYARRLRNVRASMSERGLDTLLVHDFPNIFYLTGHQTFGLANYHCLIVPARGDPVLVVRSLESAIARKYSWLEEFVIWQDHEEPVNVTVEALNQRGWGSGRIGIEERSAYLSVFAANMLRNLLSGAEFQYASGLVEQLRRIKSRQEIDYIRKTAKLTALGIEAAVEEAGRGKTENDVAAAATAAMYRGGSEFMAREPTVNSGPRSGIAHTTFRRRELMTGDSVLLEMSACYNRYSAPLMRTISIGEPSDLLKRMSDACIAALRAATEQLRPNQTAGDVERAFSSALKAAGFNAGKRAGYSIGIGFPPTWMEAHIIPLKRDDPTVLEPGMAFHIASALREPERYGAACSESVLVTESGCELLTHCEQRLFVK